MSTKKKNPRRIRDLWKRSGCCTNHLFGACFFIVSVSVSLSANRNGVPQRAYRCSAGTWCSTLGEQIRTTTPPTTSPTSCGQPNSGLNFLATRPSESTKQRKEDRVHQTFFSGSSLLVLLFCSLHHRPTNPSFSPYPPPSIHPYHITTEGSLWYCAFKKLVAPLHPHPHCIHAVHPHSPLNSILYEQEGKKERNKEPSLRFIFAFPLWDPFSLFPFHHYSQHKSTPHSTDRQTG